MRTLRFVVPLSLLVACENHHHHETGQNETGNDHETGQNETDTDTDHHDTDTDTDTNVDTDTDTGGNPSPVLTPIATGLVHPLTVVTAPGNTTDLFVVDQVGTVRVIRSGQLQDTPYLDLTSMIVPLNPDYDERGLLGLAFHPDFATNGRLFVYFSVPVRDTAPSGYDHTNVLAELHANGDGTVDMSSMKVLLSDDHPYMNHNGGTVAFGKDGYLYLAIGDGGNKNDIGLGHSDIGNGQDPRTIEGKMIRLDVDHPTQGMMYGIPADNPFVGQQGVLPEIYAMGFRNPYRFSFDMQTGDLWLGDAGQNLMEEIDQVTVGQNYGWNVKEGTLCFNKNDETTPLDSCADHDAAGRPFVDPVLTYGHPPENYTGGDPNTTIEGAVVVGGVVYRGAALPGYAGAYVFGNWSRQFTAPDGDVFVARMGNSGLWTIENFPVVSNADQRLHQFVLGFGQDWNGEVYVTTTSSVGPSGTTGQVLRLDPGSSQ